MEIASSKKKTRKKYSKIKNNLQINISDRIIKKRIRQIYFSNKKKHNLIK